nr:MAG TPA: hypothetical protein [Caudoviricetes sp.]
MGYYVHNKYDKASIDGLSTTGAGQTLVDFYTDYETYKYLDTSKGFGVVYDTLEYVTPSVITGGGTGESNGSYFNFSSSIIIKSVQRGIVNAGTAGIDVNFSTPVVPDKTVVLIDTKTDTSTRLESLSSESFKLTSTKANNPTSYQAIEFY